MQIHKVHKVVHDFLSEMFSTQFSVVSVKRIPQGWSVVAEVYEESAFIKSIGLATRVMDRNFYRIEMDENLEVTSYIRQENDEN